MDYFENLIAKVEEERDRERDFYGKEIKEEVNEKEGKTVTDLEHKIHSLGLMEEVIFEFWKEERIVTKIQKGDWVLVSFGNLDKKNTVGEVLDVHGNLVLVKFWNNLNIPKRKKVRIDKFYDKRSFEVKIEALKEAQRKDSKLKRILLGQIDSSGDEVVYKEYSKENEKNDILLKLITNSDKSEKVILFSKSGKELSEIKKSLIEKKITFLAWEELLQRLQDEKGYVLIKEEKEKVFTDLDKVKKELIPFQKWSRSLSPIQIFKLSKSGSGIRGIPKGTIKAMSELIKERASLEKMWIKVLLDEEKYLKEYISHFKVLITSPEYSGNKILKGINFSSTVIVDSVEMNEDTLWIPLSKSEKVIFLNEEKNKETRFKE